MTSIGVDLGGTKLSGAVFTPDGSILERESIPIAGRKGPEVGKAVQELAKALLSRAGELAGIGIAVPGISYAKTGRVWAPNIPGWDDYPLLEEIRSAVPDPRTRIVIDSDRACAILGESWRGAALGCKDAIFLAVGTGIGAGILVDGKILRGANDIAGAIGWLALERRFRRPYVQFGCFEYNASGDGLARVAREILVRDRSYRGPLRSIDPASLRSHDLFELCDSGDAVATETFSRAVAYWGMAVANLVSLFNPQKIIFGGGVFGPAIRFLPRIREEAARWAQPISMNLVSLEQSALGGDAVLTGAGYLGLGTTRGAT